MPSTGKCGEHMTYRGAAGEGTFMEGERAAVLVQHQRPSR